MYTFSIFFRVRFSKLQQSRVRMKEEYDQILIEREEQKKVEKQLQEVIAKVVSCSLNSCCLI